MVARVLISKNGFKISKEGFDVFTASEDNLILSSISNPFRIVASGNAVVNYGTPLTVMLGMTLPALPIVMMQSSIDSAPTKRIPYFTAGADGRYLQCQRFADKCIFSSMGSGSRYLYYIIAAGTY